MERKIGEIFEYNKKTVLKVIKNVSCKGCFFENPDTHRCNKNLKIEAEPGSCSCFNRSDYTSVIFEPIQISKIDNTIPEDKKRAERLQLAGMVMQGLCANTNLYSMFDDELIVKKTLKLTDMMLEKLDK